MAVSSRPVVAVLVETLGAGREPGCLKAELGLAHNKTNKSSELSGPGSGEGRRRTQAGWRRLPHG